MPELDIKNSKAPQGSAIKKSGLNGFLSRLFGFQRNRDGNIEFTKVDTSSNDRIGQSFVNEMVTRTPMSEKLEKYFQSWLSDNTDKLTELTARVQRISQLQYMYINDPYVNRTVALYADEATQLDDQDTIISIETPDPRMTKTMYGLLSQWGITQPRIRETIEQMCIYGDAFWANKVSERGVERIIPLQQTQVTDRMEFNPTKVMELQKKRSGAMYNMVSRNYLLSSMLDSMSSTEDFADMFDTKLFGFEIDKDLVVPPWSITHFRIGGESSEFWPFGTSPILGALSPFKQVQSTIALQSLARTMSFPITLYKVKTDENMDEGRQFAVVNKVRETYDNIGVSPSAGNSEVYTVNTKIWIPEGLLSVEVVKPETSSTDGVDDIKLYQDREAVSLGLPRSFYGEEGWFSVGSTGKALAQQYKPFGRKVYSVQSAFLQSLADLFRVHFAITGQYDFRIPFTLSMKYPAVDVDDEYNDARKNSIEIANSVTDLIKGAIGATDEDALPPDIVRDIIGKYTFLNPEDIVKWTRDAKYSKLTTLSDEEESSDEDFDSEESIEDVNSTDSISDDLNSVEENLRNKENLKLREKILTSNYENLKEELYFRVLKENAINNFVRNGHHVQVFEQPSSSMDLMLETLSSESKLENSRLQEGLKHQKTKKKTRKN